jgi:hypothetical protein
VEIGLDPPQSVSPISQAERMDDPSRQRPDDAQGVTGCEDQLTDMQSARITDGGCW